MTQPSSTRSRAGVFPVRALNQAVAPVIHALESRQLFAVSLDSAGWTTIDHAGVSDYREIYVSQSTGNNSWDGTAPENIPGTNRGPKKTLASASLQLRSGKADWLLLKKGDVWNENLYANTSGPDSQNPAVFTSYGTGARPVVYGNGGTGLGSTARNNVAFLGIEFYNRQADPSNASFNAAGTGVGTINMGGRNVLVEDCYFNYRGVVAQGTGTYRHRDLTFRRNTFANSWNKDGHMQGLYGSSVDRMTVEDNVFFRSGWNPDIAGANATIYNHALYLQWSVSEAQVKNNIIVQPSSVGAQVRGGGVVDDNLFVDAEYAFFTGRAASISRENVVMSLVGNVANQLNEQAVSQAGIQSFAPWQITEGNIVANRIESSGRSPKVAYEINPDDGANGSTPASSGAGYYDLPRSDTTFRGNVDYNWGASTSSTSNNATTLISGNYFNKLTFTNNTFHQDRYAIGSIRYSPSNLSGKEIFDGNQYFAGPIAAGRQFMIGGTYYDAAGWQAKTGETNATLAPAQFVDPFRNALTYLNAATGTTGTTPSNFYALLLGRSKDNWNNGLLTAPKINDHVRAGFVKVGQTANADPVLSVNKLTRVTPGRGIVVSSNQLQVTDADNASTDLVYFLETLPQHGTVRLNNARVDRFRTFTQADIDAGRITYEHNGDSALTDSFGFRVSDGRHGTVEASTFAVTIANPAPPTSKPGQVIPGKVTKGTVLGKTLYIKTSGRVPTTARVADEATEFDVVNSRPVFQVGQDTPLTFYVDENASVNKLLGRAVASDADLGQQLTWSIDGYKNDDLFRIDPYTGDVRLQFFAASYDSNYAARKLDFETVPQHTINVRVTDDATNAQSSVIPVTIIVRDSPEAPVAPAAFAVSIGEEAAVGSTVANWVATDPDAGDSVTYSISAGNNAGKFAIDQTGRITLANGLNFATAGQYVLTVRATDSTNRFSESKVTINVKALPKLAVNLGVALNAEQTVTLTTARLQTTDADTAASALVYTVTTATVLGTVKLNGATLSVGSTFTQADIDAGRVTYTHAVAAAAGTDGFSFTVRDERGATIAGSFAMTITDAPPLIQQVTPYRAGKGTTPIYQLTANVTDDRAAGNLLYTWSVDGNGVTFDEENGTNAALKIFATFDGPGTYTIRLSVTDGVNPPATDAVTIVIFPSNVDGGGTTGRSEGRGAGLILRNGATGGKL